MINSTKKAFADEGFTVCVASEYYCGRKAFSDRITVKEKIFSISKEDTLFAKEGFNSPVKGSADAALGDKIKASMELELGEKVFCIYIVE